VVAVFAAGAPSIGFGEAVECAARTSLDLQRRPQSHCLACPSDGRNNGDAAKKLLIASGEAVTSTLSTSSVDLLLTNLSDGVFRSVSLIYHFQGFAVGESHPISNQDLTGKQNME
jgi:hypothetical protein